MDRDFLQSFFHKTLTAITIVTLAIAAFPVKPVSAAPAFPAGFVSEAVVTNLTGPTTIAFAPDGRMFIGQKDGRVRIFENGVLLPGDFIDISSQVNNNWDRGMLGLAIHPDFPNTPYVYLLFTYDPPGTTDNGGGARVSRLIRVTADLNNTNVALPGSEVVLLGTNSTLANIGDLNSYTGTPSCQSGNVYIQDCIAADSPSHTIGTLAFGTDGSLFVSSGDGAHFDNVDARALRALNVDSLNGKILRINPITGQGYTNNPFYNGNLNSNRSKVYSLGLRNPFRTAINDLTNEPFIGDVGWNTWEEINTGRGMNFGWPCYEGNNVTSLQQGSYANNALTKPTCDTLYAQGLGSVKAPTYAYDHSGGGASVQAGAFYRGNVYPAQYQNALFISDYDNDWIRYLTFDVNGNATVNNFSTDVAPVGGIVQLLSGPNKNLYYVAYNGPTPNTSEVRRIIYVSGGNTPPTANASASPASGYVPLLVSFSSLGSFDPDAQSITYSWTFGDGGTSTAPNPTHTYVASGNYTATLTVTDSLGGSGTDSVAITIGNLAPVATITAPTNGLIYKTGDTINYSGTGVDNEDGNLSGASLQWDILLHHNAHTHFDFIPGLTGRTGSFVVPDHGDNTWIELCLTVTDSGGLNNPKCVSLQPATVTLTFNTVPSGLQLVYDGVTYTTPFNVITNVNAVRDLIAPLTQEACHNFTSWSDGGAASHQVTIGSNPITYTAIYTPCPITITVNPGQSKVYGNPDPTFTYTSSKPAATFTGNLNRASGENVGTYPINQGTLAVVGNKYSITSFIPANFTITPLPPPGAATLVSPTGSSSTNYSPTYTWNQVSGATWYYLWVTSPNGNVTQQWYQGPDICSGGMCSVTASSILPGGTYSFWIQTWNPAGYGPWSARMDFAITPPAAAILTSPINNADLGTNYSPTFTWNAVNGATWYYLWVNGSSGKVTDQWFTSAQANCNGSTCSLPSPVTLGGGNFTWWVQTWGLAGYGQWSSPGAFHTSTTPPSAAILVSPNSNNIGTSQPTYIWNQVPAASWYYLWVDGPDGNKIKQWFSSAQANCNGSTCSISPSTTLSAGTHTWWIQTWNPAGYGQWSNGTSFTTAVPAATTLVSPNGTAGVNPTYTWNQVAGATYYYLWVDGLGGNKIKQWYSSIQASCNGTTCSVTGPVSLTSGAHTWWVQTWNTVGYGQWSASKGFTVP